MISIYYGVFNQDLSDLTYKFNSREKLLKNKLCGEGQNIRPLIIQKMSLQIKVIEHVETKINETNPLLSARKWNTILLKL